MKTLVRSATWMIVAALIAVSARAAESAGVPAVGPVPAGLGLVAHWGVPDADEVAMFASTGVGWVRMDFQWELTEPARGTYAFGKFDQVLAALDARHLRPIWIFDYGNKMYDPDGASPHTEQSRAAYARWAAAAARHFAGRGVVWELWNEPNDWFWKPAVDVEQYVKLAHAAAVAIRAAAPGEAVVGPAVSGVGVADTSFLQACFKAGLLADWDAVSVHPYRGDAGGDPESVAADYARLRTLIDAYRPPAKAIPLLCTEWGYSTAYPGFTPQKQGRLLARQLLLNLWQRIPLSIGYEWQDDGDDPTDREQNFGLVRHDRQPAGPQPFAPKPAYAAVRTLTTQLHGFTCRGRIRLADPSDYALLFTRGSDLRLAVWTAAASAAPPPPRPPPPRLPPPLRGRSPCPASRACRSRPWTGLVTPCPTFPPAARSPPPPTRAFSARPSTPPPSFTPPSTPPDADGPTAEFVRRLNALLVQSRVMSIAAPPPPIPAAAPAPPSPLLPPQAAYTNEPIYRLTVEQYHRMIDAGTLTSDDPVELLEGVLVYKMPKNSPHSTAVRKSRQLFSELLPSGFFFDSEQPLTLSDGEPEPDGMIIAGTIDDFAHVHPTPDQVRLLIEVADTTLARDRGSKLRSYARGGVVQYWIVNLVDRQIELYTDPNPVAEPTPLFATQAIYRPGDSIPFRLAGTTLGQIPVDRLLPPTG